jgi:vacuolar-type H+-ATPase subunit H
MSDELIARIETRISQASGLSDDARRDLEELLATLKTELHKTQDDHAESIAGFAGAAAHEAMRSETNPDLLQLAIDGLNSSVKEVESEHPKLVEITNTICTMLSNLGI